jgi:hypothetical protein
MVKPGDTVLVSSKSVNARSAASSSGRVIKRLSYGQKLKVIEHHGSWTKVAQGAALFWIASSHLKPNFSGNTDETSPLISAPTRAPSKARKSRSKRSNIVGGTCPCSGSNVCIGPRGGRYCITSGGNKRYGV